MELSVQPVEQCATLDCFQPATTQPKIVLGALLRKVSRCFYTLIVVAMAKKLVLVVLPRGKTSNNVLRTS